MPHLEITEVVLVHCNIVKYDYEQYSRVLYKFIPDKLFGQFFDISAKNVIFLKKFNSEVPNRLHMKDKTTDAINHVKNKHKKHGTKEKIFNHITKTKTSID